MAVEPTHWIIRVGDGEHFKSSSKYKIWGLNSNVNHTKHFMNNVKSGDILWFIKNKSKGKVMSVATYVGHGKRVLGPIVALSRSNEELGYTKPDGYWDIEVHYKDLYDVEYVELKTNFKGRSTCNRYSETTCELNLPTEYANIVRYSRANKVQ